MFRCKECFMDADNKYTYTKESSKRFLSLLLPAQKSLFAYILYHVPNRNEAEDVLQDVMATMLTKFDDYQEGTNFIGWAISIAKYNILALRRNNKRMRLIFDETDMDRFQDEAVKKMESLEEEYELLQLCLKKLPEKYKRYLHFRYEMDMTYRQIANICNLSMQSVYRTIARIQTMLFKCIRNTQSGVARE